METRKNQRTMPVYIAVIIMLVIAVAGGVALYQLNDQKQKLQVASEQLLQDQQNHAIAVYEQIEANLASIREHESTISSNFTGAELGNEMLPEERIQNEINFIKNLIDENNKLIASLNEQIDLKDKRIAGYDRSVKDLQVRITSYQVQLDQLVAEKAAIQTELDKNIAYNNTLTSQVDQMGNDIVQKNSIIDDQQMQMVEKENVLHTAYYKVGTYKSLRDQNVLQKEGGVLGMNSVMTVVGSPNTGLFQTIDTREITRIPVFAKRCEIVSGQDPSSYKLEMDDKKVEWLTITDADKFWSKSKYLVIVVRDDEFDEVALYR